MKEEQNQALPTDSSDCLMFNSNRFDRIIENNKYGVFDILTYTYHPSSERIDKYLNYFTTAKKIPDTFDKIMLKKLESKHILKKQD